MFLKLKESISKQPKIHCTIRNLFSTHIRGGFGRLRRQMPC
jgi:hypothetical protein